MSVPMLPLPGRAVLSVLGAHGDDFWPTLHPRLEEEWTWDRRRLFNLDPGYITQERLVLATGKNFTHRVYLSQGIWADLTLIYQGGDWLDLPWTFPDYATPEVKTHLTRIREMYRDFLKHLPSAKDSSCPKV